MSVALVAGADRGLGSALATALAERGDEVWAACLHSAPDLTGRGIRVVEGIDVSSDDSVAELRTALGSTRLDVLISNAGINESSGGPWDADTTAMVREFNVNALGAVRLVRTLLPLLAPRAKIAMVSTGRGAAAQNPDPANGMSYGYRISKAALNMYGALLAQDLRAQGIAVVLLNPGPINTDLMRRIVAAGKSSLDPSSLPSAQDVAPQLLLRIDELTPERSGRWVNLSGEDTFAD
jgi:NAD(P)-dependent dehydrogenase (short-subunit alcohol dehydrogenase family)